MRHSVAAVLQDLGHKGDWALEWWSVYSANTLALDDYRSGRVFFVGDSAHIVPIFGVRGLNNGLADAENIAWKLARVISGTSPEALLDSYSPERRGATLDVFANATKSARFMTPPSAGWLLMRDAALSLALTHPWAGGLANPRQMTPYTYSDSPVVTRDDDGHGIRPEPGAALPEARVGDGFLSDLLGTGFTLLTCSDAHADFGHDDLSVVHLPLGSAADNALGIGPTGAVLVRPDGHIAARWRAATSDTINIALNRAIGGGSNP